MSATSLLEELQLQRNIILIEKKLEEKERREFQYRQLLSAVDSIVERNGRMSIIGLSHKTGIHSETICVLLRAFPTLSRIIFDYRKVEKRYHLLRKRKFWPRNRGYYIRRGREYLQLQATQEAQT